MKLTLEGIKNREAWEKAGITLPGYDVEKVSEKARKEPLWVHFGIGNIFRIFIGGKNRQRDRKHIVQDLIFKFFDRFLPRVLNRYDHRFDPLSFAVFVFHCNLCFAIGHYTTKATLTLLNIDFPANVVCKHKRQRKHFLGFVGGVTVYCSLIACPK